MTADLTAAERFALMLETACRDFETCQRLITGEVRLTSLTGEDDWLGKAAVQMALAKSFVFNAIGAGRICEHGDRELQLERDKRKRFLAAMRRLLRLRDVNEHGFDSRPSGRGKNLRPAMHRHADIGLVDETSMIIDSSTRVLMGPVNLYEIYLDVAEMRALYGLRTLSRNRASSS